MTKSKGFTLIELLIVVSIIGILAAIALFSYQTFLKNARNAKRQADLKLIQSALEQYHADQKYYPPSINFGGSLVSGSRVYLNSIPASPTGGEIIEYKYQGFLADNSACTDKCAKYCLYAKAENITQRPCHQHQSDTAYTLEVTPP